MKTTPNVHLLINAASRSGRQARTKVVSALRACGLEPTKVHSLGRSDDLAVVCKDIIRSKPRLLVIAGGDGTVSQTLHCFAGSKIDLGIIPLGTTNNFARSLEIPLDIEAACGLIRESHAKAIDLGVIDDDYFANVVGIGLSAGIARSVTATSKRRLGRLSYAVAGIRLLVRPAFVVTVTDTHKALTISLETRQLIVANGRYHAGKVIARDAAVDSRELIIFALGGRSRLSFITHMIDFYFGPRKKIIHGSYVIGTDFTVEGRPPQSVEVDGEPHGQTPIHLAVAARAVNVRCAL